MGEDTLEMALLMMDPDTWPYECSESELTRLVVEIVLRVPWVQENLLQ